MKETAIDLLRRTKIEVAPETFVLISLSHENYRRLLENPELSPRADAPFLLLSDKYEVTMLLDAVDWQTMKHAAREAKVENEFRLLTFTIELEWNVVGFLALIANLLAENDISVGAVSAFSRDHLLVKQNDLAKALNVLSPHVEELC